MRWKPVALVPVLVPVLYLAGCVSSRSDRLDCHFVPVETAADELPRCARRDPGGRLALTRPALRAVRSRGPGPVPLVVDGQPYYVNAEGRAVRVLWYDNGPDYFEEGLARTLRGGKVGFVDRRLEERIAPRWDFAFPFSDGFALVCEGCEAHPVGEHSEVRGGRWGYIDRSGEEVVPVRFERGEAPSPPARPPHAETGPGPAEKASG